MIFPLSWTEMAGKLPPVQHGAIAALPTFGDWVSAKVSRVDIRRNSTEQELACHFDNYLNFHIRLITNISFD